MGIIKASHLLIRAVLVPRCSLATENFALRQQVAVYKHSVNPYAEWTAQQIVDAFPYEEAPRFLLRDRDGMYGDYFRTRVKDTPTDKPIPNTGGLLQELSARCKLLPR